MYVCMYYASLKQIQVLENNTTLNFFSELQQCFIYYFSHFIIIFNEKILTEKHRFKVFLPIQSL